MKKKIIAVILAVVTALSTVSVFAFAGSILAGDVTGDGKVNALDARLVLRASAKLETLDDEQLIVADVNFDNKVNALDARLILRAAAKLDTLPEITTQEPETESTTEPTTVPDETTTLPEETTAPEETTDNTVTEYPEGIEALFSGKFYINGEISDGEQASTIIMATNGSSTEIGMTFEGFSMSMLTTKTTMYIKYPYNGKTYYFEMDEETLSELGLDGFDVSSIADILTFGSVEDYGNPTLTYEELDGVEYAVYAFVGEDGSAIKFYAVEDDDDRTDDDVSYIIVTDVNGKEGMRIKINALSSSAPKSMKLLTVSGCKEGGPAHLAMVMMSFIEKQEEQ